MLCHIMSNDTLSSHFISLHFQCKCHVMSCHPVSYISSCHVPSTSVHRLFSQLSLELKSFFFQSFNLNRTKSSRLKAMTDLKNFTFILHSLADYLKKVHTLLSSSNSMTFNDHFYDLFKFSMTLS